MLKQISYPFDADELLRKHKSLRRQLLQTHSEWLDKRVAILGGSTTADIRKILELFLLGYGIRAKFYESEYGQYWQDSMFPNTELEEFKPDIIYIHTSLRNFDDYTHFEQMWERLADVYHCPIIQNNFEYPFYRLMGNRDASHGKIRQVTEMNLKFADYAASHDSFYICDINWLSADYGLKEWSDPFYWHMYKYALALPAVPILAYNIANIIKSLFGKNKKAFALDLDNTLWGGIVGDDGAENIQIGQEVPGGQVFSEFQSYLLEHKKLGIILNINSKNEMTNALAGLNRPDSTLKPEDFIIIKANWEPKSHNLIGMAAELSLGADSFVFVDDNPAEREIVRQQVPGAAVPELTIPEHYIYEIDRAGYFEVTRFTSDDAKRSEQYKTNAERSKFQAGFTNYNEYLKSLEMNAEIAPFAPMYMSRIAQLTNKSNQFNLTTLRCTQEEIEKFAIDDKYLTLYGKLEDKFGDNGVVSVVIGETDCEVLHIRLWLMSCRVLKREMESAMMDELVKLAKQRGITELYGYYYPTAKNAMVSDFYGKQSFKKIMEDQNGKSVWKLNIQEYKNKQNVIKINGGLTK